jgi:hypothetical protein
VYEKGGIMNRRSLLAFLGLAPIAGAAAAMPRAADPVKLASTGGREVKWEKSRDAYANGIFRCESIVTPEGALSTIGLSTKADGASIGMELTAFTGGRQSIALKADQFLMSKRDGFVIYEPIK